MAHSKADHALILIKAGLNAVPLIGGTIASLIGDYVPLSCYIAAIRTSNDEKLRGAAAILANLLLKSGDADRLSYTELDHAVRCLAVVVAHVISLVLFYPS